MKTNPEKSDSGLINNWKKLPDEKSEIKLFFMECRTVYESARNLVYELKNILIQAKEYCQVNEDFVSHIDSVSSIIEGMKKVSSFSTECVPGEIDGIRLNLWKGRLYVEKLAISKLVYDLVSELLDSTLTEHALRLAELYNDILLLDLNADYSNTNVFGNTCPMLLYPLRKLSITRILQLVAVKRAEKCSYSLISGILNNYYNGVVEDVDETIVTVDEDGLITTTAAGSGGEEKVNEGEGLQEVKPDETKDVPMKKLLVAQNSLSSNTSVEIYRALTKHLESKTKENETLHGCPLEALWKNEEKHTKGLLTLSARVSSKLLGCHSLTSAKSSGNLRPKSFVKNKLTNYYQQVLWGEVGGYLEHILLWWSSEPLGSFPPSTSQSLRDYLVEIKSTDSIPTLLVPSINSLLESMCCHQTSTSWDQLFRKTLVSSHVIKTDVYKAYGIEGSATGQLFVEMFSDLIKLNNSCENSNMSLEELPFVEQIPILHRLDHSVHTVRLWVSARCKNLAAKWDLDGFYSTCFTDINNCLQTLSTLKLQDHNQIPLTTSVQVTVSIKMRSKLVSEIRENIEKLKKTANECINILAKNCRIQSLAILYMYFPPFSYWRQSGALPDSASDYVEKYLECVLQPVFAATKKMSLEIQQSSSTMVLRILCESWLEYVYLKKVKFSEWGAVQLLMDFGAIPTWLTEKANLPKELLNSMVSHEVLKRCEGVGRLLLRRRGESIKMTVSPAHKSSGEDSSKDNMPAEMYVTNQEQWLELRAPMKVNICCQL